MYAYSFQVEEFGIGSLNSDQRLLSILIILPIIIIALLVFVRSRNNNLVDEKFDQTVLRYHPALVRKVQEIRIWIKTIRTQEHF